MDSMSMWEWSDELSLGKGSTAFVKQDIRRLPQSEAEFEADFFLDDSTVSSRKCWMGMVIEREHGDVLAMEEVRLPPPTVNSLANLLAHAMLRPPDGGDRSRPRTIHLRDRPQWQELLPHVRQLGIEVILCEELPRFDEAVLDWLQRGEAKGSRCAEEIVVSLRKPFPKRERTWFTDAMVLMEWTAAMSKGAHPSRTVATSRYDPLAVVPMQLMGDELEDILTNTTIAKTKQLRPRLEAMAAENKAIQLTICDWSSVLLALCGSRVEEAPVRTRLLRLATRIAHHLAELLEIDSPVFRV